MGMTRSFIMSCLLLCSTAYGRDLRVGAFNIQVFGVTKMSKPEVVDILVKIIKRYDLLLIQEIRDSTYTAIYDLLSKVNHGEQEPFMMELSPRLGRTISKEQYAFFYRPDAGLEVKASYVYNDVYVSANSTMDKFEREPYILAFTSANTDLPEFSMAGIHVSPENAVEEINGFYGVFYDMKTQFSIPDAMIMGDLNADCNYVSKSEWAEIPLKLDPAYKWWIGDDADTTVKATECAYDRFISTGQSWLDAIVPGSAAVYKFDQDLSLGTINETLAEDVSDHYPIEFLLKEKQYSVTKIEDVYVVLYAPTGSLPVSEFFPLKEGKYVYDDQGTKHGELREETAGEIQLRKALLEILLIHVESYNGVELNLYVEPIKNRWSGRQRSNLYIAIPVSNQNFLASVQNILNINNVCAEFVCDTFKK